MKQSKQPLWKKSMLNFLNYDSITNWLSEISNNGDYYGYEREEEGESGYYQEYKELKEGNKMPTRIEWCDQTINPLGYGCYGAGGTADNPNICKLLCKDDCKTQYARV